LILVAVAVVAAGGGAGLVAELHRHGVIGLAEQLVASNLLDFRMQTWNLAPAWLAHAPITWKIHLLWDDKADTEFLTSSTPHLFSQIR